MNSLLIPKQSEEFIKFRNEIIKKFNLTWEEWCWLWDKLSIRALKNEEEDEGNL